MSKDTQKRIADALNAIRTDGGITTSDATKSTQKRIRDAAESIRDLGLENVPLVKADKVDTKERFVSNVGVIVELTSKQNISDNTPTKVAIDTARYDDRGEFDASNNRIEINNSGRYLVSGKIIISGFDDGSLVAISIRVNGTIESVLNQGQTIDFKHYAAAPKVLELDSGDHVELFALQQSGGSASIISGNGNGKTHLNVTQIA